MPNILHRASIDAPSERVHQLTATKEGIQQWWTGHPVAGEDKIGGLLSVYFREPADPADPAATFEVVERPPGTSRLALRRGPPGLDRDPHQVRAEVKGNGGSTLLFSHEGWRRETEFMNGWATNWAAYLMSLKSGAEGDGFNAYPAGEISRWD